MEFLSEYGMFFVKSLTIAIFIVAIIVVLVSRSKERNEKGEIKATVLNDDYDSYADELRCATMSNSEYKKHQKELDRQDKEKDKDESASTKKGNVYVLDFNGDTMASQADNLRNEITAILGVANKDDEVVLRLESPGGAAHSYGLASSQLDRLKKGNLKLTICVDKVAASGGYMMACVAHKIIAAPFAIIGSVGVVAEFPNFNRVLKKAGVDYETFTAGNLKRTVTPFGENTEDAKKEFSKQLNETHDLFKSFVKEHREVVDIDEIATGQAWYGTKALEKKLIDEISTSDQYLTSKAKDANVIHVEFKEPRRPLSERMGIAASGMIKSALIELIQQNKSIKHMF